jgi:hypothetical protein
MTVDPELLRRLAEDQIEAPFAKDIIQLLDQLAAAKGSTETCDVDLLLERDALGERVHQLETALRKAVSLTDYWASKNYEAEGVSFNEATAGDFRVWQKAARAALGDPKETDE